MPVDAPRVAVGAVGPLELCAPGGAGGAGSGGEGGLELAAIRPRAIPAHELLRETMPRPARPSARFTWTAGAAAAVYVTGYTVPALVQGLPADPQLRGRAGVLVMSAIILGATASGLWRWAGQPWLTRAQQSRIPIVLGPENVRLVRRALRRGEALPGELHPWAAAHAVAAGQLLVRLLGTEMVVAGWAMASAGDGGFPHWVPLGFLACYVVATTAAQVDVARQRRRADQLRDGPEDLSGVDPWSCGRVSEVHCCQISGLSVNGARRPGLEALGGGLESGIKQRQQEKSFHYRGRVVAAASERGQSGGSASASLEQVHCDDVAVLLAGGSPQRGRERCVGPRDTEPAADVSRRCRGTAGCVAGRWPR